MPIRIYDIAKKLGLENRQVLSKAKELGIDQARVASSQLDKITGEYLEEQLRQSHPPAEKIAQPSITASNVSQQQLKAEGITIRTTGDEVYRLVERILAGEIPFAIEVARTEDSPPLRAKLVMEATPAIRAPKPKVEPAPCTELDEHSRRIFLGAYYYASSGSKDGWVNLAEYGSTLKKQDPTFQPQDFGERSLGGLIRRMTDIFDIKTDGNTPPVYYIRLKPNVPTFQTQPHLAPLPPALPTRRAFGQIHNLKLGFGFIAPEDGSENIFFHATEVVDCTIFDLRPGDPVEYESGVNERGPCAWKVRRLIFKPQITVGPIEFQH